MGANSGERATLPVVVVVVGADGVVADVEVTAGGCARCPQDGTVATVSSTAATAPTRATRDPDTLTRMTVSAYSRRACV